MHKEISVIDFFTGVGFGLVIGIAGTFVVILPAIAGGLSL